MVPELGVLLSKRSSRLNCFKCIYSLKGGITVVCYEPYCYPKGDFTVVRYQPYCSSMGDFTVVRYEPNCSRKGDFIVVRYEPNCSHYWNLTKGRFYCSSLRTLLLPLLGSYQGEILLWFANCSLKGAFTVVHYEPNCSHSWNLTKGRFYYGSL